MVDWTAAENARRKEEERASTLESARAARREEFRTLAQRFLRDLTDSICSLAGARNEMDIPPNRRVIASRYPKGCSLTSGLAASLVALMEPGDENSTYVQTEVGGVDAIGVLVERREQFPLTRTGPRLVATRGEVSWSAGDLAEYLVGEFAKFAV